MGCLGYQCTHWLLHPPPPSPPGGGQWWVSDQWCTAGGASPELGLSGGGGARLVFALVKLQNPKLAASIPRVGGEWLKRYSVLHSCSSGDPGRKCWMSGGGTVREQGWTRATGISENKYLWGKSWGNLQDFTVAVLAFGFVRGEVCFCLQSRCLSHECFCCMSFNNNLCLYSYFRSIRGLKIKFANLLQQIC